MSPSIEVCKTLNCMDDPMKVLIVRNDELSREDRPIDDESERRMGGIGRIQRYADNGGENGNSSKKTDTT